jgi:hypothetical protein
MNYNFPIYATFFSVLLLHVSQVHIFVINTDRWLQKLIHRACPCYLHHRPIYINKLRGKSATQFFPEMFLILPCFVFTPNSNFSFDTCFVLFTANDLEKVVKLKWLTNEKGRSLALS